MGGKNLLISCSSNRFRCTIGFNQVLCIAIKRILVDDGYDWNDTKVLLHSLTRACRLINDKVRTRLPIQSSLMEVLLFEIQRYLHKQPYLITMYSAMIALGYYGLLRIGELTESPHVIKAMNVNISRNKEKILIHLYSSKTHGAANRPQTIKNKLEIRG